MSAQINKANRRTKLLVVQKPFLIVGKLWLQVFWSKRGDARQTTAESRAVVRALCITSNTLFCTEFYETMRKLSFEYLQLKKDGCRLVFGRVECWKLSAFVYPRFVLI